MSRHCRSSALVLAGGLSLRPASPGPPGARRRRGSDDTIKAILDQELEPAPGGYTYNPPGPARSVREPPEARRGRHGPEDPQAGDGGLPDPGGRPEGHREDRRRGRGEKPATSPCFLGTDGKSYFVNVGQRLFDGEIIAIDGATVTFRQEVTDPLSPVKTREVKKTLYPSEEARQ